jgi:hypothetical protein
MQAIDASLKRDSPAFEGVVAESPHSAECLFEVSDAQRRPSLFGVKHLDRDPMAARRGRRKVPPGDASCERTVRSPLLSKQIDEHHASGPETSAVVKAMSENLLNAPSRAARRIPSDDCPAIIAQLASATCAILPRYSEIVQKRTLSQCAEQENRTLRAMKAVGLPCGT